MKLAWMLGSIALSGLLSCGGGHKDPSGPAEPMPAGPTGPAKPVAVEDDATTGDGDGELGTAAGVSFGLYAVPVVATAGNGPPVPESYAQSRQLHEEAVGLYEEARYPEAAVGFLAAADVISANIDPYFAESFADIRRMMCGNAGWAFLMTEDVAGLEEAATARESNDPACAAGLHRAAEALSDRD